MRFTDSYLIFFISICTSYLITVGDRHCTAHRQRWITITFYNVLDLTGVGKGNTLVSPSRASNVTVIMGFGTHTFPLVTGCHMLFYGFRLVLGRDERMLQGSEKYMNQLLGCPGAQKEMT